MKIYSTKVVDSKFITDNMNFIQKYEKRCTRQVNLKNLLENITKQRTEYFSESITHSGITNSLAHNRINYKPNNKTYKCIKYKLQIILRMK